jgi:hypothetical protein
MYFRRLLMVSVMANRRPKLNPYASSMATTPQNFYKTELSKALRENAFGIKGYQLTPPSVTISDSALAHAQAIARVELLEGLAVFLRLTYVGYEVRNSVLFPTILWLLACPCCGNVPFVDCLFRLLQIQIHMKHKAHKWRYQKAWRNCYGL